MLRTRRQIVTTLAAVRDCSALTNNDVSVKDVTSSKSLRRDGLTSGVTSAFMIGLREIRLTSTVVVAATRKGCL